VTFPLLTDTIVSQWQGFQAETVRNLPSQPFLVTTDDRPRYELTDRFVKRNCYDDFEHSLLAISSAVTEGRAPAASVLGPKGAGTSSFFRYFVYKQCAQRLVVYVPNAGDDEDAIFSLLMKGLVFGLQCLNTKAAELLLSEVRKQELSANLANFQALWNQWLSTYPAVCDSAFIVIDQLRRTGRVFNRLAGMPLPCAGYILISSTGILHHHNLSSVYKKMVYFFPVSRGELNSIDKKKLLDNVDQVTTMMGAIDLLEGRTSNAQFISAARQHYKTVKEAEHLNMLLALVQSEESGEAIDGGIWDEALDSNYLWVDESKMVKCTSPEYTKELRKLLSKDKVEYKKILTALLSDQHIVDEVGNAALGVHVEALLDIMWQEFQEISWSQQRLLETTAGRASRTKGQKQINAIAGETFKEIQPIHFDGDIPTEEDLQGVDWDKAVYFKPTKTNYAGFDMFVLRKKGKRWVMYGIQVTVSKAADHGVDAFDDEYVTAWEDLLRSLLEENLNLNWEFYMLTPQDDPSPTRPSSVSTNIPIFQVGFGDLAPTRDRSCGIQVVRDFVALLKAKRDRKKQKT
jgi:hypothetical protein